MIHFVDISSVLIFFGLKLAVTEGQVLTIFEEGSVFLIFKRGVHSICQDSVLFSQSTGVCNFLHVFSAMFRPGAAVGRVFFFFDMRFVFILVSMTYVSPFFILVDLR